MTMPSGPVLVTGATGTQGGAVTDALLEAGYAVRALVRDPSSPRAAALAARGVALSHGHYDDPRTLDQALDGAVGLFSVQVPPTPQDPDREVRQARLLATAARAAGVATVVHTSVARAGEQQGFVGWSDHRWWPSYWNNKSGAEAAMREAGFAALLILKPAFMMNNLLPPKVDQMFPTLAGGTLLTAIAPATRLHLVAAADIARFACAAFDNPARFGGHDIPLAAEALTMREIADAITGATGRRIAVECVDAETARASGLMAGVVSNHEWLNVEGYKVEPAELGRWGLPLTRFADWAAAHAASFSLPGAREHPP